jgi:hypothetical protein
LPAAVEHWRQNRPPKEPPFRHSSDPVLDIALFHRPAGQDVTVTYIEPDEDGIPRTVTEQVTLAPPQPPE